MGTHNGSTISSVEEPGKKTDAGYYSLNGESRYFSSHSVKFDSYPDRIGHDEY